MTETPLQQAHEAVDKSASDLAMGAASLQTICEALVDGPEDEQGAIRLSKTKQEALDWVLYSYTELIKDHIQRWDCLHALLEEEAKSHAE